MRDLVQAGVKQTKREAKLLALPGLTLSLFFGWQSFGHYLTDSRTWRDVTGTTPFRDVQVLLVSATELEIRISGTLVKSRPCMTIGQATATVHKGGLTKFALFENDLESSNVPSSRPASGLETSFGPWRVTSPIPWPDSVSVYRAHQCGGEAVQENLVFTVAWPKSEAKR